MNKAGAPQTQTANAPTSSSHAALVQRKCACGGSSGLTGACSDCEKKKLLGQPLSTLSLEQTKLRVNEPGDQYEQEADRVAEQVMRMPGNDASASAALPAPRKVNAGSAGIDAAPAIVPDVLSSPGQPLDAATRAFFEPRFGHDFGSVRVHTDGQAQQFAESIHARAFTVGRDIALGTGQYFPGERASRRLLAHELAHVLQQQGGPAPSALIIQRTEGPDDQESVPEDAAPSVTWTISEQPHAGTIRDSGKGFVPASNRKPIPPGTIVSPLDYREELGITYAWVEWSGGIDWVLKSDLLEFDPKYATPRGDGAYSQNVKSFPANAEVTPEQTALLERAMKFIDDGSIQTPKEMDELRIDAKLASRLKTYYRFLVQEDLITDEEFPMSGSREPWVAHELSTKWMLNRKNSFLGSAEKRIEFAKLLVEIGGKDGVTEIIWANVEQVRKLSEALRGIANLELARFLIPPAWTTGGWASTLDWDDPRIQAILDKYHLADDYKQSFEREWNMWPAHTQLFIKTLEKGTALDRLTIDLVVAEIRNHFSSKEQKPQEAPALEGYPKGARERYPNVMDVEMTQHLTGHAADIHFPYKFYYFDPIIDALAKVFGLSRVALKGAHGEYWHYQAVGQPLNGASPAEERKAE